MTSLSKFVSRRRFVGGSSAISAAAVMSALFGPTNATATQRKFAPFTWRQCANVHVDLSNHLTRIVADPSIGIEKTNLALRSTRCPHCDTQINAAYPALNRRNGAAHV